MVSCMAGERGVLIYHFCAHFPCYEVAWALLSPSTDAADTIPEPLYTLVVFFSEPYPFLALFLTGGNLTNAFDQVGSGRFLDTLYFVGTPVWLCIMKNVVCPLAAISVMQALTPADEKINWLLFCLLYGSIPTSNAPLFVAIAADSHLQVIATAIFIGLVAAVPSLVIFASLHGQQTTEVIANNLTMVQKLVTGFDLGCTFIVLLICVYFTHLSACWRRLPTAIVTTYAASIFLYDCSLFLNALDKCRLSAIFGFFQMQSVGMREGTQIEITERDQR